MDEDLCDEILDEKPEDEENLSDVEESNDSESSDPEDEDEEKPETAEQNLQPGSDNPEVEDNQQINALHFEVMGALAEMKLDHRVHLKSAAGAGCDDSESVSGFSVTSRSTAATIAPEVIKGKIKKSFEKGDKMNARRRIRAKGEASAVTRSRRDTMENIKHSDGIWGWK